MTPQEREAFYDAEIAPALLDLAKRCNERGLSFVALADWSSDGVGVTGQLAPDASPQARWTRMAALCRGNIDVLMQALAAEGKGRGHSSVFLSMLGVPKAPTS